VELPANVMLSTGSPDFAELVPNISNGIIGFGGLMMWTVLFGVAFSIAALLTICVILSCYTPEVQRIPTTPSRETKNP
jgi:hypothetical protein